MAAFTSEPMAEWTAFVWRALHEQHGGEIFVPKCKAWRLGDLAAAVGGAAYEVEGRNGDKRSELLISNHEAGQVVNAGWSYVIEPPAELRAVWAYQPYSSPEKFVYHQYGSDSVERLTVDELRRML